MSTLKQMLHAKRLYLDTGQIAIAFLHKDSPLCKTEGFRALDRISLKTKHDTSIIATLYLTEDDTIAPEEIGLSEQAWKLLKLQKKDLVSARYPEPLSSLGFVRGKMFGKPFSEEALRLIVKDITAGRFSDIHLSAFVTACTGQHLNLEELVALTQAMVDAGDRIVWPDSLVVDKHCVGGLPGNRTTPVVVSIVASYGLTIPKTSSRAITSPAGTADTIETLMPVNLDFAEMQTIARKEKGCLAWGGSVSLSPADDLLIRVERALDLDSQSQLAASILSKKIAAGSTHIVIDIPIGPTAKVRDQAQADRLKTLLLAVAKKLELCVKIIFTNGLEPIGHGIGPALEARDVLAVLQNQTYAPQDLKDRSIMLAGHILEFSPDVPQGAGKAIAQEILESGQAWQKFQSIAKAQGGLRKPPIAPYIYPYTAQKPCKITQIDNRRISRLAKLAGAPFAPAAGLDLHFKCEEIIGTGETILTIHAETEGQLHYATDYLQKNIDMLSLEYL